jgi:septal ring-binding cell division protein DamX
MWMQDLERLGNEMEAMKGTAPTHPHPHAPNEGAAAKMAGMAAGTADRVKDAATGRPDAREVRRDVQSDRGGVHPPEQRLER